MDTLSLLPELLSHSYALQEDRDNASLPFVMPMFPAVPLTKEDVESMSPPARIEGIRLRRLAQEHLVRSIERFQRDIDQCKERAELYRELVEKCAVHLDIIDKATETHHQLVKRNEEQLAMYAQYGDVKQIKKTMQEEGTLQATLSDDYDDKGLATPKQNSSSVLLDTTPLAVSARLPTDH